MTRSFVESFERMRVSALFLAWAAAFLLVAGHAVADEPEVDTTPPAISGAISPGSLSHEGGNVQLSAEVVDESGVQMVYAVIYGSDGPYQATQLYEGYLNNYFGTFEVPANYSDSPMSYGVEIQAYDTNNNFSATSIGEVQVEGQPQFDEAPYLSAAIVWPQFLPSSGGTVTISADASDNRSISSVFATIAVPGGSTTEVPLNPVSSSHYEGTFEAPANSAALAAEYPVEVVAEDDIGQQARAIAGTITVEPPPRIPSAGLLDVWPGERWFGNVKVGKEAQRRVFVRNLPRRGEPVEATAMIVGSSAFSLAGASPEGIHFMLRPGEKRSFLVAFQPTHTGPQAGFVQIVRDDGAQPGLAASLSGQGARR